MQKISGLCGVYIKKYKIWRKNIMQKLLRKKNKTRENKISVTKK